MLLHPKRRGRSGDLRWEEDLEIRVPQGYPKIAVGLFHPSSAPGRAAATARRRTCNGRRKKSVEGTIWKHEGLYKALHSSKLRVDSALKTSFGRSIPGRREKCVGWMSLKVDELLDCLPVAEHGYSLLSEDKTLAGKARSESQSSHPTLFARVHIMCSMCKCTYASF